MPAGCITAGPNSVSAGNGQLLACAAVLQPVPISCHFRGCKAPLSSIVSGAITSELPLPFTFQSPVKSSPLNYQHPTFLQAGCPYLSTNQQLEGLSSLSLTTEGSWSPRRGRPRLSSSLWHQYPSPVKFDAAVYSLNAIDRMHFLSGGECTDWRSSRWLDAHYISFSSDALHQSVIEEGHHGAPPLQCPPPTHGASRPRPPSVQPARRIVPRSRTGLAWTRSYIRLAAAGAAHTTHRTAVSVRRLPGELQ